MQSDFGLLAYFRAFAARWFTAMSGPLAVPLAIAAVFVPNNYVKIGLGLTALVCAIFASYWTWRIERMAAGAERTKIHELLNEYPYALKLVDVVVQDRRELDEQTKTLKNRWIGLELHLQNCIHRPVMWKITMLKINGQAFPPANVMGGGISANARAVFHCPLVSVPAPKSHAREDMNVHFRVEYGPPDHSATRLLEERFNLEFFAETGYRRWIYELDSDRAMAAV